MKIEEWSWSRMDLIKNLGISYRAGYLVQGNQIERCNTSTSLNVLNTE